MKIYQCKKEYCPFEDDPEVERPFEVHSKTCMFANGVPEGMCCSMNNKQEAELQKSIERWM